MVCPAISVETLCHLPVCYFGLCHSARERLTEITESFEH